MSTEDILTYVPHTVQVIEFWKFKIWINLEVMKTVKDQHQGIMLNGFQDY